MVTALLRRLLPTACPERRANAARSLLPGPLSEEPVAAADALLDGTLRIPGFVDADAELDAFPWSGDEGVPRAYLRQLHGHAMLRDLVHAFRRTGRGEFLDRGANIVADWVEAHPREDPGERMAWHDEATAMRVQSWLLLREELVRLAHPQAAPLTHALAEHAALLATDWFHSTGTNHGMFQDEALITYASLIPTDPHAERYFDLATERLLAYFDLMITPDGVHREHSPAYHNLIAGKIARIAEFYREANERGTARRLEKLHGRMSHYATHVIMPDGRFPLVSDTFAAARPKIDLFDDAGYRWAVSRGRRGQRPSECNVVFPEGGYAIFRDAWRPDGRGTYLHFTAAYHTDYHKHSDDLSIWLYHDGDLLTEAGPNGYDYADPYTVYGYSAHAHNSLIVDGESLPRVDDHADEVHLTAWDTTGPEPWARGRNGRFDDVVHEREVRFLPGRGRFVVSDTIHSEAPHDYTLLWNCAPGVEPTIEDGVVTLRRHGQPVATVTFDALAELELRRIRGDIEGRRGFRLGGNEPIAAWVIEVEARGRQRLDIVHTIELHDERHDPRAPRPLSG